MVNLHLKDYLQETKYCNFNDSSVKTLSMHITSGFSTDQEKAVAVFNWVRDSIQYRVGLWQRTSSETLKEKKGTCTNSANLFVALLRAVHIPAGFGVMDVIGPEYFGPVAMRHLRRNVSKKTKHIYCCAYLNNKWLRCDPSDDEPLSTNTHHLNPQSKIIEWDGQSDAMLNLDPKHILRDEWPVANIDHILEKKIKHRRRVIVYFGNLYIQFLREEGRVILHVSDLDPYFDKWLRKRSFIVYYLYKTFFLFESIIRFDHNSNTTSVTNIN